MSTMLAHSNRNITVFIADDSLIVREHLVTMFDELAGIEIVGKAENVADSISAIEELKPDVVILDIRMPGGSGIDVLQTIKQVEPAPVVIILTNYPYSGYRKKCLQAGADFFLDKSTEFDQIPELFERHKQDKTRNFLRKVVASFKENLMQFKIGDVVVHPAYGIGHIIKIKEKQFSKKNEARLYYQITMPNRNTMWTPVEDQVSNGLRLVPAKSDLDQYRKLLKSRPVILENHRHSRYLELVSRLKYGSFKVMCEVVRDLTVSGWQKPLGATARNILQKTRWRVCQEWASAADISIAEATREIGTLLRPTQEAALN